MNVQLKQTPPKSNCIILCCAMYIFGGYLSYVWLITKVWHHFSKSLCNSTIRHCLRAWRCTHSTYDARVVNIFVGVAFHYRRHISSCLQNSILLYSKRPAMKNVTSYSIVAWAAWEILLNNIDLVVVLAPCQSLHTKFQITAIAVLKQF